MPRTHTATVYIADGATDDEADDLLTVAYAAWEAQVRDEGMLPVGQTGAQFVTDAHPIPGSGHARAWVVTGRTRLPRAK